MMENTGQHDVVHQRRRALSVDFNMPFLAGLAADGVTLTNMWGTYHPSDQNYVAMVAGDTYKFGPVYYPDYNLPVTHLGDLLELARRELARLCAEHEEAVQSCLRPERSRQFRT